MWYRSISTLPLNKFIDCSVDKNLASLTISGFPSASELFAAWADIQQEYADAIGNMEHKAFLTELKEIWRLRVKLALITDMVDLLRKFYYKPFADRLNKLLLTKFAFDYSNEESYTKELNSCINRSKSIKINIDLKELNLEGKKGNGKPDEPVKEPTRQYYQSYLITLSDHAKYPIQDTITVMEYCERIKRYNAYCESMDKLYKKK